MKVIKFLIVLLLATFLATSSSPSQASQYGNQLFSGSFTFTGQTIQSLQIVNTGLIFLCDLQVYENMLIYNNESYFRYVGNETVFTINYRRYNSVDSPNEMAFFVSDFGTGLMGVYSTQFIPYVGNLTTVTYAMFEPGDTRAMHGGVYTAPQGGNNNNYGGSSSGNVCVICGGSGNCTNPRSANNYKEYCQGRRTCANCGGTGHVLAGFGQSGYVPCSYCNRRVNANYGDGICGKCHGTGRCHHCNGTGYR